MWKIMKTKCYEWYGERRIGILTWMCTGYGGHDGDEAGNVGWR